jgi:2-keto-3-deoxy-L-rhamnonate aldolase RhmA
MSTLKQKINRKENIIGAWVSYSDPACIELMGRMGFDFMIVDAEHSPIQNETLRNLLMANKGSPTAVLVRVPWNDLIWIKSVLDLGADGVLVPMVNSAEEARRAVSLCKFPPDGIRSVGPWRVSNYYQDDDAYVRAANAETVVLIQIEHVDAVNAVDEILKVPGLDGIFLGPSDLAGSMNHLLDIGHPDVQAAIVHVAERCKASGITFGLGLGQPKRTLDMGARLFMSGQDSSYLASGARAALAKTRGELGMG